MKLEINVLLICAAVASTFSSKVDYTGYKIIRMNIDNKEQWEYIHQLKSVGASVVFGSKTDAGLLLPPHLAVNVIDGMKKGSSLPMEVVVEDVQKLIDSQKVNQERVVNGELEWDRYYNLADIHQFLMDQAEKHNAKASVFSLGKTHEGRDMLAINITKSGNTKPAIWIDSLIHAREWITGAVCTFIIDQLLNSDDPEIQSWLDEYDFYITPVLNPDGYEFTHTTDRFWRKSRKPNGSPVGCIGTDLNRNFDYHWLENGGASDNPCAQTYAGTHVFSDPEAENVKNFLESISSRLVFYLSLHSAGQYILFPTGLNSDKIPQYETYMAIGNKTVDAHRIKYGTNFEPGSIFDLMYVATGSSMDWVKDKLKTNLTYTYELRDKGQYGHLLPPNQILPSALEFMDGLKVTMEELSKGIPEEDPEP